MFSFFNSTDFRKTVASHHLNSVLYMLRILKFTDNKILHYFFLRSDSKKNSFKTNFSIMKSVDNQNCKFDLKIEIKMFLNDAFFFSNMFCYPYTHKKNPHVTMGII